MSICYNSLDRFIRKRNSLRVTEIIWGFLYIVGICMSEWAPVFSTSQVGYFPSSYVEEEDWLHSENHVSSAPVQSWPSPACSASCKMLLSEKTPEPMKWKRQCTPFPHKKPPKQLDSHPPTSSRTEQMSARMFPERHAISCPSAASSAPLPRGRFGKHSAQKSPRHHLSSCLLLRSSRIAAEDVVPRCRTYIDGRGASVPGRSRCCWRTRLWPFLEKSTETKHTFRNCCWDSCLIFSHFQPFNWCMWYLNVTAENGPEPFERRDPPPTASTRLCLCVDGRSWSCIYSSVTSILWWAFPGYFTLSSVSTFIFKIFGKCTLLHFLLVWDEKEQ